MTGGRNDRAEVPVLIMQVGGLKTKEVRLKIGIKHNYGEVENPEER